LYYSSRQVLDRASEGAASLCILFRQRQRAQRYCSTTMPSSGSAQGRPARHRPSEGARRVRI